MRPQPPLARAEESSSIFWLGRPVSSHMSMLPMGAMTMRFLRVRRFTLMGEKSAS